MERSNTTRGGGRGEEGGEGGITGFEGTNPIKRKRVTTTSGNSNSNINSNSNKKKSPRSHPPPPPPPSPSPSPSSSMLLAQPRPCLVQCLSFLDSESIRQVCLLSKEYHSIIHNDPDMANMWTKLLEIRPSSSEYDEIISDEIKDEERLDILIDQLYHHRNEIQMIQDIRIIDPHKFKLSTWSSRKVVAMMRRFKLDGIISLRMVSPSSRTNRSFNIDNIFNALKRILPLQNLRLVDLSNCSFYDEKKLPRFLKNCSSLEQITYNNNHNESSALEIIGTELKNCSSLTEINMDNSTFVGYNDGLSNLNLENEKYSKLFLFWKCSSKVLQNVSIKNARYYRNELVPEYIGLRQRLHRVCLHRVLVPLPQAALIKFVRNGPPSLRYFRSDLTPANREMLRLERPDIVFS